MPSVTLNNGQSMPSIGLGVFLVSNVAVCERSVEFALRSGYRLIDTAAAYGNERAVGRGIVASGVARSDIFLTTKIWVSDYGYVKTSAAIERSLDRLGTDRLDLLLLHQPFGDYLGSWRAMEQAVADGRVNSIGVSNFLVPDLERLLSRASIRPAVNQIERHPYFQQRELAAFLAANDIAAEAWYPLGHGSKDLLAEPVFTALAAKYSKTAVQVILRWHLQTGFVAIPKSTNTHHIEQNLDVFDFELTDAEVAAIANVDRNRPSSSIPRPILSLLAKTVPIRQFR